MVKVNSSRNSFNKENEHYLKSSAASVKRPKKYLTKSLKVKVTDKTEGKLKLKKTRSISVGVTNQQEQQKCVNPKQPLVEIKQVNLDNTLQNLPDSLGQDEIRNKLIRKKKVLLNESFANACPDSVENTHSKIITNSGLFKRHTPEGPLKIPKQIKLNKCDLKLKSPFPKESLDCNRWKGCSKSNISHVNALYSNNKNFALFEGKLRTFQSSKIISDNGIDREAYDIFSFSPKHKNFKKSNQIDMGPSFNFSNPLPLKVNLPHGFVDRPELFIKEAYSDVNKSTKEEDKTLAQEIHSLKIKSLSKASELQMGCNEEFPFVSPILGNNRIPEKQSNTDTSPVLKSTINLSFKNQKECSQIINSTDYHPDYHNHKEVISKRKCVQFNDVVEEKSMVSIDENEKDNSCDYLINSGTGSPVLKSSQRRKDVIKHRFNKIPPKALQDLDSASVDFSPSPVLDAKLFIESSNLLKCASKEDIGKAATFVTSTLNPTVNLIKNESKVSLKLNQTKPLNKFKLSLGQNKAGETDCSTSKDIEKGGSLLSLLNLDNKIFDSPNVEQISQPLSQVLSSNRAFAFPDKFIITCSPVLKSELPKSKFQEKKTEEIQISVHHSHRHEDLEMHCQEKNDFLNNMCSLTESPNILAVSNAKTSPNESKKDKYNSSLDGVSSTENCILTNFKRYLSPKVESSLKLKRRKSAANEGELEDQGPMLSLVVSSPGSDNVLCNNLSTLDQDETLVCSPSFNSALDIRKFPLMLSDITESNSPKEKFEKCLQDNKCDTNDKLENCSRIPNVKPNPEEMLPKELHQEKNKVVNKVKTLLSSLTENPLTNAGLVNAQDPGSPILEGQTFRKPKLPIVSCEPPILKGSINVPKNETTKCITNPSDHSGRKSGKRRIRKNLSLYFEEVKPGTYKINDKTSKSYCDDENRRPLKGRTTKSKRMKKSKLNWTLDDDELVCLSQISGVGNLQPNPIKDVNCEKVSNVFDGNQSHVSEAKCGTPRHREDKSSKVNVQNHKLQERTASLHLANWKNQVQLFCDSDVCIEDFDEESPIERAEIINRVEAKKVDSVKRNLNNFESDVSTKQLYPEPKSMFLNFQPDNQNNTCEYPSSEDSCCDVEIQEDFSQRTFARSPAFKIEYSTTPNTKSSEETQNETDLQPPSFPPALEIDVNTASSAVIIDSACKNKRTRVKKGSLVERLRRLVRGQRAEVNMFHHEISAPRTNTKTCSLSVVSTTQACSLLMLNCRYTDASRTSSQDYGSGEEIVDPEVHVYVDPSYTKNIREGCNITVFPPWRSLWYESRGVVVMYQVTKIRLETTTHKISLPVVEGRQPSHTSVAQFTCQTQDEQCGCRNQLVSQLFTAPLLSVQPHNAADGALTAALAGGWYPHRVKVKLTLLHRYQARCHQNKVQTRILCVDSGGLMCQLNLRSEEDILKLGLWKESEGKTFVMRKLTVSRRVFIDRSRGLRSFLSYLHPDSSSQQIMYVATPADDWTAQLIETTADKQPRITIHQQKLLTLPIEEEVEGRAKLQVKVMAVRRDELFAWEPQLDLYIKLNITSTAAVPNFPARSCLDMSYIWAHQGELTIDKFTEVSIVELKDEDSPNIPPLAVDSAEGNLVLLDSIVTKVSSDAYLRWEGSCGHKVMRVQKTGQFYCLTCRQTSASSTQKVVLEVCVVAVDIPHLIRVKVKSETARVLLAETSGQISSEKSYNMIGVIGSTLKCLAIVSEVLRNSFGDIIEFVLEEL